LFTVSNFYKNLVNWALTEIESSVAGTTTLDRECAHRCWTFDFFVSDIKLQAIYKVIHTSNLSNYDRHWNETQLTFSLSNGEPITTRQLTLWFAYSELSALVSTVHRNFFEKILSQKGGITQIKCWMGLSSLVNRLGSTLFTSVLSFKLIALILVEKF
jgi:hypothetical protein